MSCQHGNWYPCDECNALAAEYQSGFEHGKADGWQACETCHSIVSGKHQELEQLRSVLSEQEATIKALMSENVDMRAICDQMTGDIERTHRMLLTEPDTRGALFKAENILRDSVVQWKQFKEKQ